MKENTTLRDQFAMAALGILVNDMLGDATYEETAREAYRYADAMLAVRDASAMTVEEAAGIIANRTGESYANIVANSDRYRVSARIASARVHPDAAKGSMELWLEVERARAVLDAHHGITGNGGKP